MKCGGRDKVRCKLNEAMFRKVGHRVEHVRETWRDDSLRLGVEFEIYGLGIYQGNPMILIDPEDNCRPNWYSLSDVTLTEATVPHEWEVSTGFDPRSWTLLLGYSLLVRSDAHFDGILERDDDELVAFYRMKKARQSQGSA